MLSSSSGWERTGRRSNREGGSALGVALLSNTNRQTPKPQFEDGSVYRQNRPTRLDKIKNLHTEIRSKPVVRL